MIRLEILVEEPSCEIALRNLLPRILPAGSRYSIRYFQGKTDLLKKLPDRLEGYKRQNDAQDVRIVVLADEDREDCTKLKAKLEKISRDKGFITRTTSGVNKFYQMANRIAVEELEAWFFGDIEALTSAFPGLKQKFPNLKRRKEFLSPDTITGGTWEALEKLLKSAGYYTGGLQKLDAARKISEHMQPDRNCSPSFKLFRDTLREIART